MGKVINAFHHSQVCSRSGVANCGSPPVFLNKVLLDHSQDRFVLYHLWLLVCYWSRVEELWWRPYGPQNQIYLLPGSLQRKFADLWFQTWKGMLPAHSGLFVRGVNLLQDFRFSYFLFLLFEIACISPVFSLHSIWPRLVYLEPHPSVEMGDMKERVTTFSKNEKQCEHILRKAVYYTLW